MRTSKLLILSGLMFMVSACATTREGMPTGQMIPCQDGNRPLMDCRLVFEQYQRVLKFDVNVIGSYGTGFGIGAQPLINLDSITGDLLAHQQQVCIEYNNCMITMAEYKEENKFLRRAQIRIREMANTARMSFDNIPPSTPPPLPPVTDNMNPAVDPGTSLGNPVIDNALNSLEKQIQEAAEKKGLKFKMENPTIPTMGEIKTMKKVGIEYSLLTRREKPSRPGDSRKNYESIKFSPGTTLRSGDQFKLSFKTDGDGYVYVVNFDPSGKAEILFPHLEAGSDNRVKGGQTYEIPASSDTWYYLDDVKGEEILYIVASPFPIPNLDSLVADLKQGIAGPQTSVKNARLRGSLESLTRGIGVATSEKNSKEADVKTSILTAERIEFKHN